MSYYDECSFDESREFYTEEEIECSVEDEDTMTGAEQGFMAGYINAGRGAVI